MSKQPYPLDVTKPFPDQVHVDGASMDDFVDYAKYMAITRQHDLKSQVITYITKYDIHFVCGENWTHHSSARHLEAAREIAGLLKARGLTVRISEVHEGYREVEVLKPDECQATPRD